MRRRAFIAGLGSAAAALAALAQQPALPVIGWLGSQSVDDDYKNIPLPFLQGLKETGYVEGQNVVVEYRYADNQYDRLPSLAADLVRHRVAVIRPRLPNPASQTCRRRQARWACNSLLRMPLIPGVRAAAGITTIFATSRAKSNARRRLPELPPSASQTHIIGRHPRPATRRRTLRRPGGERCSFPKKKVGR
jgi:hypothetical protein